MGDSISSKHLQWFLGLTDAERERHMTEGLHLSPILSPLYEGEEIVIEETDGQETLAKAKDVFTGYLDSDFEGWNTNHPSAPSQKQRVRIYEMRENAKFAAMFTSLNPNLDSICLTEHQIKSFCRKHKNRLRQEGYGTFFLFKSNGEYFVAGVGVGGRGLGAGVDRFGYDRVWSAGRRPRVVAPQL